MKKKHTANLLFPFSSKARAFFQNPIENCHELELNSNSFSNLLSLIGEKQSLVNLNNDYFKSIHNVVKTIFNENKISQKKLEDFIFCATHRISNCSFETLQKLNKLPFQEQFDLIKDELNNDEFVIGYIPLYFNNNSIIFCELVLSRISNLYLDFKAYPMLAKTDGISTQFYNLDSYIYADEFDNKELIKTLSKAKGLRLFTSQICARLNSTDIPKDITFFKANEKNTLEQLDDLKDVFNALHAEVPISFMI